LALTRLLRLRVPALLSPESKSLRRLPSLKSASLPELLGLRPTSWPGQRL
jgi:hypothetical protein